MRKMPAELKKDLGRFANKVVDWGITDKGLALEFDSNLSRKDQEELAKSMGIPSYLVSPVWGNGNPNSYHIDDPTREENTMRKENSAIEITEDVRIPGTDVILEVGDKIEVLKEDKVSYTVGTELSSIPIESIPPRYYSKVVDWQKNARRLDPEDLVAFKYSSLFSGSGRTTTTVVVSKEDAYNLISDLKKSM